MSAHHLVVMHMQLGASDCEALGDGLLAQPANTISSGVYLVVGLWLVALAVWSGGANRTGRLVFGVLVAGVGVGSGAFHGLMPVGARFLHDLTIAALLGFIVVRRAGLMRGWSPAAGFTRLAVLIAAAGLLIAAAPDAAVGLIALLGTAALGLELAVHSLARHDKGSPSASRWLAVGLALLAVAGLVNLLGRTGGPWCDPASVLQPHALWHVITAVVFGLYGWFAFPDAPSTAVPNTARSGEEPASILEG